MTLKGAKKCIFIHTFKNVSFIAKKISHDESRDIFLIFIAYGDAQDMAINWCKFCHFQLLY